ncbi:MAG: molybdopterin-guanine dinucleotide biosynthesis protein B [Euryarchaeota archaeon]|nr:molybdopterin-guanine dinucleotide biosynthesis protein B [Euryarchaeota archaeon]
MKAFSVVGIERSVGKTSLVEALVKKFISRGYKVGTIKHVTHDPFTIDTSGKDTFRHSQAGAKVVVSVASSETAVIYKTDQEMDASQVLDFFQDVDLVVVEGWSSVKLPRVIIARTADEAKKKFLDGAILAITGPIAENASEKSKLKDIPIFDNRSEILKLADLIEDKLVLKEKIPKTVELKIDGKHIPLVPFVQDFIKSTITGMVSSLKKVEPNAKEIRLIIRK